MRTRYVTSLALALTLVVAACSSGETPATSPSPSAARSSSSSPGAGTSTTSAPARPGSTSSTPASFGYVPLWPFASVAAAEQWQREAVAGGHQPWRLDAGEVAVTFARQYLGFTEVTKVIRKKVTTNDAHVTVGWTIEGSTGTVAVVHLVRIGSGTGRPWEVVGTDDTATFSLTRPRYGSTVAGTITVGGRIAGVDESIRVTARQLSGVVGGYCCLPAGAAAPWAVRLRLTNPKPGPITIVASTGGHIADVERFTVTGVRSGQ
ncbi:MAG TPA: hypothetical protein VF391_04850 [Dermatophilaceae bacterium]|jgi:hypothetical protein